MLGVLPGRLQIEIESHFSVLQAASTTATSESTGECSATPRAERERESASMSITGRQLSWLCQYLRDCVKSKV